MEGTTSEAGFSGVIPWARGISVQRSFIAAIYDAFSAALATALRGMLGCSASVGSWTTVIPPVFHGPQSRGTVVKFSSQHRANDA